jgi:2-succinyl-6-hydroxy-2,4-cyclohexadiene-1-carboxylate synthase
VPESVVLLHGFGGTRRTWNGIAAGISPQRYRPVAIDLPGHGEAAAAPRPITFDACTEHVLARSPERFTLCGYSLGGRVALHVALAAPERVRRLLLLSTSAGIEDGLERARRRASDRLLVAQLGRVPLEQFIAAWNRQPLFAGDPPAVGALAREQMRRNRADALAAVLAGIGSGEMQPLWHRLGELAMPATVMAGDRDRRYQALARRLVALLPHAELAVIAGGHRLPLENPSGVVRALDGLD